MEGTDNEQFLHWLLDGELWRDRQPTPADSPPPQLNPPNIEPQQPPPPAPGGSNGGNGGGGRGRPRQRVDLRQHQAILPQLEVIPKSLSRMDRGMHSSAESGGLALAAAFAGGLLNPFSGKGRQKNAAPRRPRPA
jgi:hypothetical protein